MCVCVCSFFVSKKKEKKKKVKEETRGVSPAPVHDMDGGKAKEGWCMLRYAGGVQNSDNEIINRTMLRFRPIAPKPVSSGTVSGNLLVDRFTSKRSKRKYVRVRKNNGYKRKNNNNNNINNDHDEEEEDGLNKNVNVVTTLQLLPERPTTKDQESFSWCNNNVSKNDPDLMMGSKVDDNRQDLRAAAAIWLNMKGKDLMINGVGGGGFGVSDQTVVEVRRRTVVESWVTVESVTADTCMDILGRCLDVEGVKTDLDKDTCPGFISDGFNRVLWVNKAYKKMAVNGDGCWPEIEIMVWLVLKEKLPSLDYSLFASQVRLQYTWQNEKYSKMVPCDAFRMDGGGFAWRLDVEAALSLGR